MSDFLWKYKWKSNNKLNKSINTEENHSHSHIAKNVCLNFTHQFFQTYKQHVNDLNSFRSHIEMENFKSSKVSAVYSKEKL